MTTDIMMNAQSALCERNGMRQGIAGAWLTVFLLSLCTVGKCLAAQSATGIVTAEVSAGSCMLSLDYDAYNSGVVDPDDLREGGRILKQAQRTLSLNCTGGGAAGKTPTVTLTGETMTGAGGEKYLFRRAGITGATGVGFVLGSAKTETWPAGNAGLYTSGSTIPVAAAGESVPGNTTLDFYVGVACGSAADCAASLAAPGSEAENGEVRGSVMFTFAYQ
ncbi:hypothetical protein QOM18_25525 [Serratia marcescens]|uniref:fimbrial protein n=1 Tax=Serratia marcescens TaxID=615 RepID=UPI0024C4E3EB|nr:hypothetical protein [Serratia marcescens]MDK1711684.1 hypothetical protein [Serratia marcescens]